jgi:hypothetical protein
LDSSAVSVTVTGTTANLAGDYTGATVELMAPSGTIDTSIWINVNDNGNLSNFSASVSPCAVGIAGEPGCVTTGIEASGSEDHFGTFDLGTGATKEATVTFTLTAEDGFSWTDAANVLTPTTGYYAGYGHGFEAVTATQDAGYYAVPAPSIGPGPLGNSRRLRHAVRGQALGTRQKAPVA